MNRLLKNLSLVTTISIVLSVSCARSERASNIHEASQPKRIEKAADSKTESTQPCVNLNKASAEELMQLPRIGEVTARRIVDHRERNGEFRRKEEIIIVDGFSERKYREIADMICVE